MSDTSLSAPAASMTSRAWTAWQEPPSFLDSAEDVACVSLALDGPLPESLHPTIYLVIGMAIGALTVGFVCAHEMKMLLARAREVGVELRLAPTMSVVDAAPVTARGKRDRAAVKDAG